MKLYISADIEGVTGITVWDEATRAHADYGTFRQQMQREVEAACTAAVTAGATYVFVKDAHDTARNLEHWELPEIVELGRGWSGHPFMMVEELDQSYDALLLVGYHSPAGSDANPLAHTMSGALAQLRINGQPVAEFHLNAWTAASVGVPTVFVAGDAGLCEKVQRFDERIRTVATNTGRGTAVTARHPRVVVREIGQQVAAALGNLDGFSPVALPASFRLTLQFKEPAMAYRRSFYPGAVLRGERTVVFETDEWFEVARAIQLMM